MSPDRSARRRAPTLAGIGIRIGFVAVLALVAANAFLAWIALGAVETRLEPVIKDKAHVLARSIANDLNTAVRLDIPVEGLRGVDAYLEDLLTDHPEVAYLAVTDAEGKVLFSAEAGEGVDVSSHPFAANAGAFVSIGSDYNIAHPLVHGGKRVGHAMVGIDRRYVRNTMAGIFTDIGISLCVAILIVLELTLLVLSLTVARSIGLMRRLMHAVSEGDFSASIASRGRDDLARVIDAMNGINTEINRRFRALVAAGGTVERLREGRVFAEAGAYRPVQVLRAGDVQYPLFFFIFGVELSRPFFPLFVRDLYDPSLGIDASIAIAMPMSVWVVAMLFTTPLAPTLIRRLGTRNTLLLGMAPTSVGLIATAFATGFVELIAWRCVTAAGFGLVTAAILVRLAITAPERRRALNIGVFVTATGGGSICATAIGGILAERLGYENTFIVGATIVFVAMTITFGFLSSEEGVGTRVGAQVHRRRFGIYGSPRFMTFMALSALPSRTVLTGFLFFLVPLYLDSLDFGRGGHRAHHDGLFPGAAGHEPGGGADSRQVSEPRHVDRRWRDFGCGGLPVVRFHDRRPVAGLRRRADRARPVLCDDAASRCSADLFQVRNGSLRHRPGHGGLPGGGARRQHCRPAACREHRRFCRAAVCRPAARLRHSGHDAAAGPAADRRGVYPPALTIASIRTGPEPASASRYALRKAAGVSARKAAMPKPSASRVASMGGSRKSIPIGASLS